MGQKAPLRSTCDIVFEEAHKRDARIAEKKKLAQKKKLEKQEAKRREKEKKEQEKLAAAGKNARKKWYESARFAENNGENGEEKSGAKSGEKFGVNSQSIHDLHEYDNDKFPSATLEKVVEKKEGRRQDEKSAAKPVSISARIGRLQFHHSGKFRILQFTDIQESPRPAEDTIRLIEASADAVRPDIVIFNGNQIAGYAQVYRATTRKRVWYSRRHDDLALAHRGHTCDIVRDFYKKLTEPLVQRKIPWAVTFGNHDSQCGLSNCCMEHIVSQLEGCVNSSFPCVSCAMSLEQSSAEKCEYEQAYVRENECCNTIDSNVSSSVQCEEKNTGDNASEGVTKSDASADNVKSIHCSISSYVSRETLHYSEPGTFALPVWRDYGNDVVFSIVLLDSGHYNRCGGYGNPSVKALEFLQKISCNLSVDTGNAIQEDKENKTVQGKPLVEHEKTRVDELKANHSVENENVAEQCDCISRQSIRSLEIIEKCEEYDEKELSEKELSREDLAEKELNGKERGGKEKTQKEENQKRLQLATNETAEVKNAEEKEKDRNRDSKDKNRDSKKAKEENSGNCALSSASLSQKSHNSSDDKQACNAFTRKVPYIIFQHFPLPQYYSLLKKVSMTTDGAVEGYRQFEGNYYILNDDCVQPGSYLEEGVSCPDGENGEFESAKKSGCFAISVGHDHRNGFVGVFEDILLAASPTSGFNSYGPPLDKRAARLFEFDLRHPYEPRTQLLKFSQLVGKPQGKQVYTFDLEDFKKSPGQEMDLLKKPNVFRQIIKKIQCWWNNE